MKLRKKRELSPEEYLDEVKFNLLKNISESSGYRPC